MFTRLYWDSWTENWELWLQELSRDAQQLVLVCQDDLTKQHGWTISMNFWKRIKSLRYLIKLGQWCEKKKLVKMLILVRLRLHMIIVISFGQSWRHYFSLDFRDSNKILILGKVGFQSDQITAPSWSGNTCQPSNQLIITLIRLLFVVK